jgi:putative phosphoserine phosphatase / 1-acylglycerol-3-phosphate O-acyltransferase
MLKEGRSVCIAPEGTRSTSTHVGRFKKGAFHLAMQAGVPIVPIVIHNAIDVAPRGQFVFKPATVKVSVLPPIPTSNWRLENLDQHIESVRDQFLIELDQMQLQTMKSKAASRKKAN